jgi:hypothetical protein
MPLCACRPGASRVSLHAAESTHTGTLPQQSCRFVGLRRTSPRAAVNNASSAAVDLTVREDACHCQVAGLWPNTVVEVTEVHAAHHRLTQADRDGDGEEQDKLDKHHAHHNFAGQLHTYICSGNNKAMHVRPGLHKSRARVRPAAAKITVALRRPLPEARRPGSSEVEVHRAKRTCG